MRRMRIRVKAIRASLGGTVVGRAGRAGAGAGVAADGTMVGRAGRVGGGARIRECLGTPLGA